MAQREDKVSISIRLDPQVHRQLVEAAERAKSPLNGEIQRRLAMSLENAGGQCVDVGLQLTRIEHTVSAIAAAMLAQKGKKA
jgi:hypothetical protein